MLDPGFLHQLPTAATFQVWPNAVRLHPLQPVDILDLIGPANDMAQLRTMKGSGIQRTTPAAALAAWEAGATIQVRMVHLLWPEALQAADAIAEAAGMDHTGVSVFWSRGGWRGASPHQDTPDVVALQLQGVKRWIELAAGGQTEKGVYNLRSGDAMLIRSGTWHVCDPLTDCTHLAVRLVPKSA